MRQRTLLEYLARVRGRPVSFTAIRRYLEAQPFSADFGRGYSQRTLQRDIRAIADTYGESIQSRRGQGYYLEAELAPTPASRQRLDELAHLHALLQLPEALRPYVQPESRRSQGLEHLLPLLRAAQTRQIVEFQYQKHWEDAPDIRTAGPLLLKEFRGRWYVLAVMAWSGRLACFGLDRIHDLQLTVDTFAAPAGFDAASYYADAFGITRPPDQEPQEIILRFSPTQGRYALGYPLHASQHVLLANEAEIRLSLRVYPTYELYMELLSYGPEVEVLAPPKLREWLRAGHREAAST